MFKYFTGKLNPGFVSIFSARMILRVSSALFSLFLPIFLYELFDYEFKWVVYFYLSGYILYALTVAWGAKYLNRIGLRRSLRVSLLFGALYYFFLYIVQVYSDTVDWAPVFSNKIAIFIMLAVFMMIVHRIMYWLPIHTDMAKFTDKFNRGKEVSLIKVVTLAFGAIGPIFAGWVIAAYSYDILFIIVVVVYFLALIPLMTLPRTREKFSWGYFETWKKVFSKKRRRTVAAFFGDGAEQAVGLVVWPVFIFELLQGNYFEVGALSSLIVVATVILQLLFGKLADTCDKKRMIHWGSALYALGWVIKIFILTAFQIFIASTYHNLTKIFARTPFDALTYEKAADQGHFVDEFTVIHEIAINLGKSAMLVLALVLATQFGITGTFVLAALASLLMNYLADEDLIAAGRHAG